jgi:uncharacterized protein (TIGR02001 family)
MRKDSAMKALCFFPLLTAIFLFAAPGFAAENDITANVAFVSQYAFRGVTQSDESPALQGGVDYDANIDGNTSFYIGAWASTVDFNDGDEASVEADIYGGFNFEVDRLTLSTGLIYYAYPGADSSLDYDFLELQAKILYGFDVASVEASINYSPDYFAGSGDSFYFQTTANAPLPHDFSLKGHLGYQVIDDDAAFELPDYTDWSLGLGYSFRGFNFSLSYVDTNLDRGDCPDGCESRAIFGVSRAF